MTNPRSQNGPGQRRFFVAKRACKTCIYGPRSASRRSIEELEAEAGDWGYRECHVATIHGNTACCAGSWARQHSSLLRVAKRLKVEVFVDPETMQPEGE